ncbi:hypothetical protein BJV77DRAFT_1149111 [Russula vinacea]|nr:hypothetical protein BJV77DRAFT_1149111 [Russula vinacea]
MIGLQDEGQEQKRTPARSYRLDRSPTAYLNILCVLTAPEHLRNYESRTRAGRAGSCGAKVFYNETPPLGVRFNQGGVLECWNSGAATQRLTFKASSNVIGTTASTDDVPRSPYPQTDSDTK